MACSRIIDSDELQVTTDEYPRWILCWRCIATYLGLNAREEVVQLLLPGVDPDCERDWKVPIDTLASSVIPSHEFSLEQKLIIVSIAMAMTDDPSYWDVLHADQTTRRRMSSVDEILKRLTKE